MPLIETSDSQREQRLENTAGGVGLPISTFPAGLGPLGQKYVESVLRGTRDKQKNDVDYVYSIYLHKDGLMFGNKRFDVDDADNIIIDGV